MRYFVVLLLAVFASPAMACFSGLTQIPTAETVGNNGVSVEAQFDGPISPLHAATTLLNTEFGFGDRLEAGVDIDVSSEAETRALANAKYVFASDTKRSLAFAAGIYNTNPRLKSVAYLVATSSAFPCGCHGGVLHNEQRNRFFVGVDRNIGKNLCIMLDHIQGEENSSAVGVEYDFGGRYGIVVGQQYPNG